MPHTVEAALATAGPENIYSPEPTPSLGGPGGASIFAPAKASAQCLRLSSLHAGDILLIQSHFTKA